MKAIDWRAVLCVTVIATAGMGIPFCLWAGAFYFEPGWASLFCTIGAVLWMNALRNAVNLLQYHFTIRATPHVVAGALMALRQSNATHAGHGTIPPAATEVTFH